MRTSYSELLEQLIQAIIAIIVIGGAIAIAIVLLLNGRDISNLPSWLTLALGAVLGFYFGQRGVGLGISKGTNGVLDAAKKVTTDANVLAALNRPDTDEHEHQGGT